MNYYELLGVPREATEGEINSAYRRLALQHHPDRHTNVEEKQKHSEIFKQVAEAFSVLSDTSKRSQYDAQGYVGRRPPNPPKPPPRPTKKTKTKEDFEQERAEEDRKAWQRIHASMNEPMHIDSTFMDSITTGRHVIVRLMLTPEEKKRGGKRSVLFKKRKECGQCIGDGYGTFPCPQCGHRNHQFDVGWCNVCDNSRTVIGDCPLCKGTGLRGWIVDEISINIPPNVPPGHTINVIGSGEPAPKKAPGNVRVIIV